ncbi:hypothetical protein IFM89_015025, partial [Coptis chinensis]
CVREHRQEEEEEQGHGRLSYETILSSQTAEALLKSMKELPVLVVAGAEDGLVSLKSAQVMASKLVNSHPAAKILVLAGKAQQEDHCYIDENPLMEYC